MNDIRSKVMEMKSLRSFFGRTQQDDLKFGGEGIHLFFWSYDIRTDEWIVTEGLKKLFGYSPDELSQPNFFRKFFFTGNKMLVEKVKHHITRQTSFAFEYEANKKDGSNIWIRTKGSPVFDSHQEIICYNGVTQDITAIVQKEAEMTEMTGQYQALLEQSAQAVYILQNGKYQYATKQMEEITGYSSDELAGMDYDQILDQESVDLVLERMETFLSGKETGRQELAIVKKDQTKRTVELRSTVIAYKGKPALMGTLLDITEKKKALELANRLAYYDVLTGLPNRKLFCEKMGPFLKAVKEQGTKVALLFVNLDQYKTITDLFGHHAGDEVIKEASSKLAELMPDKGFIARYGDTEFVALLPYTDTAGIKSLAQNMIRDVPLAFSSEVKDAPIIGISLFPEHTDSAESLLRFANIAMYQSRRNEKRQQNYNIYSPCMLADALRTNKLTNALQQEVEYKQYQLMYQPKVWLDSGELEGVEALIRWEHPEFGHISPLELIPLAEKSGHIIGIGDWVLERAIQDMQKVSLPIILNVNISMRQLLQDSFVWKIKALIERTGFPAQRLNLEITESMAAYDIEGTIAKLEQLQAVGVKISLDDFGTGYSSLSYLTRLPIDCLKIDRSFVNGMEMDESKKTLIRGIIQSVHDLKLEVIAEGIETKEQTELLKSYNCEKGQGFFFSKPLSLSELLKFINLQQ